MTNGLLFTVVPLMALGVCAMGAIASPGKKAVLYHASFRTPYQAGVYEGVIPMERLRANGDFGLGATHENDGELVALGGTFWRSRADGTMQELGPNDTTPYAVMTFFRPERTLRIRGPITQQELEKKLDAELDPDHRIYAVRIRGRFVHVEAGNGEPQEKPYRPLEDVLREYQWRSYKATDGTLVGFRCPEYMRRFDRVGYHFHYLSDDKKAGGHVNGYAVDDVEVAIQELGGFTVDTPGHGDFYGADLVTQR
ncbi:acetolactate decarboxylase [Pendulispora brunnea]|uniref:Alpha-acetolactate decarboxylase n=1 Tax=Pendulispora brunnea TaxID=2905690 RepID=A0ABZ2K6D7_9BACT